MRGSRRTIRILNFGARHQKRGNRVHLSLQKKREFRKGSILTIFIILREIGLGPSESKKGGQGLKIEISQNQEKGEDRDQKIEKSLILGIKIEIIIAKSEKELHLEKEVHQRTGDQVCINRLLTTVI